MIPEYFIFLAAAINIASNGSYVWETLQGRAQPNRVTWIIWSAATLLAAAAQFMHGAGWPTLIVFTSGALSLLVVFASFVNKKAYWKLGRLDYACGTLSLLGLVLWIITSNPLHAVIFSVAADALATLPTLIKSYKHPESEDGRAYLLALIANTIAILTITQQSFIAYAFTANMLVGSLLLTCFVYRHRLLKLFRKHTGPNA